MSRRKTPKKRSFGGDQTYQSILVNLIVNRLLCDGKKNLSYSILYSVLQKIQIDSKREPLAVLEHAIRIVIPIVQLKSRRVGGTNYQIPVEVDSRRGITMAIQWILAGARSRPRGNIVTRLSREILDAAQGRGIAVRKREEVHRMAEANKAFARYRF
jgi:small subunit ribosomal protein S7